MYMYSVHSTYEFTMQTLYTSTPSASYILTMKNVYTLLLSLQGIPKRKAFGMRCAALSWSALRCCLLQLLLAFPSVAKNRKRQRKMGEKQKIKTAKNSKRQSAIETSFSGSAHGQHQLPLPPLVITTIAIAGGACAWRALAALSLCPADWRLRSVVDDSPVDKTFEEC